MTKPPTLSLIARLSYIVALLLGLSSKAMAAQDNVVFISTSQTNVLDLSAEPENSISLTITGENNGGLGQNWPALPAFASAIIQPGTLSQTGTGNMIEMTVLGSDNLFAIMQNGTGNQAVGHISGAGNTALVVQTGHGNVAMFHQQGIGNSVAISQSSW